MNKFEFERSSILNRLNHPDPSQFYQYIRNSKLTLLEDIGSVIPEINISSSTIIGAIEFYKENLGIIFKEKEMISYAKLHPETFLIVNKYGIDTMGADQLMEDCFKFFLDLPSPMFGHKLRDEELQSYFNHLKHIAKSFNFEVTRD